MPYTAAVGGLEEHTMLAIETLIQNNITGLNTTIERDNLLPNWVDLTSECVKIGDCAANWDPATEGGSARVCVLPPNEASSFSSEQEFIDVGDSHGKRTTLRTEVILYFHADVFRIEDPWEHARARTLVCARAKDWFRAALFSNYTNMDITLASQEYSEADKLTHCRAETGSTGLFKKTFEEKVFAWGIRLFHVGDIAG